MPRPSNSERDARKRARAPNETPLPDASRFRVVSSTPVVIDTLLRLSKALLNTQWRGPETAVDPTACAIARQIRRFYMRELSPSHWFAARWSIDVSDGWHVERTHCFTWPRGVPGAWDVNVAAVVRLDHDMALRAAIAAHSIFNDRFEANPETGFYVIETSPSHAMRFCVDIDGDVPPSVVRAAAAQASSMTGGADVYVTRSGRGFHLYIQKCARGWSANWRFNHRFKRAYERLARGHDSTVDTSPFDKPSSARGAGEWGCTWPMLRPLFSPRQTAPYSYHVPCCAYVAGRARPVAGVSLDALTIKCSTLNR